MICVWHSFPPAANDREGYGADLWVEAPVEQSVNPAQVRLDHRARETRHRVIGALSACGDMCVDGYAANLDSIFFMASMWIPRDCVFISSIERM